MVDMIGVRIAGDYLEKIDIENTVTSVQNINALEINYWFALIVVRNLVLILEIWQNVDVMNVKENIEKHGIEKENAIKKNKIPLLFLKLTIQN